MLNDFAEQVIEAEQDELIPSLKDEDHDSTVSTKTKNEGGADVTTQEQCKEKKDTKTTQIIKLMLDSCDLFHDKNQRGYATIKKDSHHETYTLRSKAFRHAVQELMWRVYNEGIGGQILQDAIGTLEGHANYAGECYPVFVRRAERNGIIYLDLGNDCHEVVEISADGWTIRNDQNTCKFRRPSGMTALPCPIEGGNIEKLKKYVNLANADDWPVLVGFILMCLNPWGPYPVLVITGEQGSAKTTLMKIIKTLLDASVAACRTLPGEVRDLAIAANNTLILAFDNISHISTPTSDALCRLSTGGGFATRTLHTDEDESIFDNKNPVILNGITNSANRHDLADREILIPLDVISEEKRMSEDDFWNDLNDDLPEILGAILTATACALKNYKTVKPLKVPRMADFAIWIMAAETALGWPEGTFLKAYSANRREVVSETLDADIVGSAVKKLMEQQADWEGTASELLDTLDQAADERTKKLKWWPHSANGLSGKLKRSATALRAEKIEVTIGFDAKEKKRFIRLEQVAKKSVIIDTDVKIDTQTDDIKNNSTETMSNEKIVPESLPNGKDFNWNDGGNSGNDAIEKIVPDIEHKDSIKMNTYAQGNDRNDSNNENGAIFHNHHPTVDEINSNNTQDPEVAALLPEVYKLEVRI